MVGIVKEQGRAQGMAGTRGMRSNMIGHEELEDVAQEGQATGMDFYFKCNGMPLVLRRVR